MLAYHGLHELPAAGVVSQDLAGESAVGDAGLQNGQQSAQLDVHVVLSELLLESAEDRAEQVPVLLQTEVMGPLENGEQGVITALVGDDVLPVDQSSREDGELQNGGKDVDSLLAQLRGSEEGEVLEEVVVALGEDQLVARDAERGETMG